MKFWAGLLIALVWPAIMYAVFGLTASLASGLSMVLTCGLIALLTPITNQGTSHD